MEYLFIGGTLDGRWLNISEEYDHYSAMNPPKPQVEHPPKPPTRLQIIEATRYVKCRLYNGEYRYSDVFVLENGGKENVIKNLLEGYKAK